MKKFYTYYLGISVLLCISASIVFSSAFRNIQGGIWAGLAGLVAAQCFVLHCLFFSNKLQLYYRRETLNRMNIASFVIVLLASTFFIWYIFAMVYWKIPISDYEKTPVFSCIFTFMTGKWGLHLFGATKEYSEFLNTNYSPIEQTI